MVNETLDDIFNEFYSRKNNEHSRIKELEYELDGCWAKISSLQEENNMLEDDIYDRNDEIEDLKLEIRGLNSKIKEYEDAFEKGFPLKR